MSFNPQKFSTNDYIVELSRQAKTVNYQNSLVCEAFLGLFDDIRSHGEGSDIYPYLRQLPKPFRGLMAIYQSYGAISSGGYEAHFKWHINPLIDFEVLLALPLKCRISWLFFMLQRPIFFLSFFTIISDKFEPAFPYQCFTDCFEEEWLGPRLVRALQTS